MKPGRDPLTLAALQRRLSDEAKCFALLERARWPHVPECPACGVVGDAWRITTRPGEFTCRSCKRRFSVTAGTPMHRTRGRASDVPCHEIAHPAYRVEGIQENADCNTCRSES